MVYYYVDLVVYGGDLNDVVDDENIDIECEIFFMVLLVGSVV